MKQPPQYRRCEPRGDLHSVTVPKPLSRMQWGFVVSMERDGASHCVTLCYGSFLAVGVTRDIRATFQRQLWGLKRVRTNKFALGVSNEKWDLYPQVRGA